MKEILNRFRRRRYRENARLRRLNAFLVTWDGRTQSRQRWADELHIRVADVSECLHEIARARRFTLVWRLPSIRLPGPMASGRGLVRVGRRPLAKSPDLVEQWNMPAGRPANEARQLAMLLGDPTYIGAPHSKCGTSERYVAGSACVHCARVVAAEQRDARKLLQSRGALRPGSAIA